MRRPAGLRLDAAKPEPQRPDLGKPQKNLDLVPEWIHRLGELPQPQFQTGFHSSKGSVCSHRDLPVTHPLEKRQLDRLTLERGQLSQLAIEKFSQVAPGDLIRNWLG